MGSLHDALKAARKFSEDVQQRKIASPSGPQSTKQRPPLKPIAVQIRSGRDVKSIRAPGMVRTQPVVNRISGQTRTPAVSRPTTLTKPTTSLQSPKPSVHPIPPVKLDFSANPKLKLVASTGRSKALLSGVETLGTAEQCRSGKTQDAREVTFGLDFGTSSVKVVIGDMALDKAFAVPFRMAKGLDAYLLPTRLFQTIGQYSLIDGEVAHRDLKLAFVADPNNLDHQIRIVAFLALVIARARGWLFGQHFSAYKHTEIVWKVAIGLPAASSFDSAVAQQLHRLTSLAWHFAATPNSLNDGVIRRALTGVDDVAQIEISVVPEIAAQIYGFVVSTSFDKRATNIYLMVDVGAGTVDSSLFHVKPGRGGKWDFEFFTTTVEPHGVTNLHRHRVNWWTKELAKTSAPKNLSGDVISGKFFADSEDPLPNSYIDYFDGVKVTLENGAESPDAEFFNSRVVAQVRGKTLWRARNDSLLDHRSFERIPLFLCGGGARMEYYLALEKELEPKRGYSWLKAEAWTMGVPGDLIAEGLADADYDRISVAYGLSRLEVGKVIKAIPLPKTAIEPVDTWRANYVDKDQC